MKKLIQLLLLISFVILFLGSKNLKAQKVSIIITGNLGNLFHPQEADYNQALNIKNLDDVLHRARKLYPEAVFVDAGNFLNWPDISVTCYKSPAMAHFRTHRYDVANLGARELFLSKSLALLECPLPDHKPAFLSLAKRSDNGQNWGQPFMDVNVNSKLNLRVMGATPFDSTYSAPPLMSFYKFEDTEAAIINNYYLEKKENSINVLLSSLSPAENDFLAEKYPSINVIIESNSSAQKSVRKISQTFIVHRNSDEYAGHLSFLVKDDGNLDKIKYQAFPIHIKSKSVFSFLKKRHLTQGEKSLARIGGFIPDEKSLNMIKPPHDSFEVKRLDGRKYADELDSTRIYYYALYKDHKHVANTFFVDRSQKTFYPPYLYLVTVSPNHELLGVDFIAPFTLVEGIADVDAFLKPYIGKTAEELRFNPIGCSGAEEEFMALHNHIRLVLELSKESFR